MDRWGDRRPVAPVADRPRGWLGSRTERDRARLVAAGDRLAGNLQWAVRLVREPALHPIGAGRDRSTPAVDAAFPVRLCGDRPAGRSNAWLGRGPDRQRPVPRRHRAGLLSLADGTARAGGLAILPCAFLARRRRMDERLVVRAGGEFPRPCTYSSEAIQLAASSPRSKIMAHIGGRALLLHTPKRG